MIQIKYSARYNDQRKFMKKVLIWILVILSVGAIGLRFGSKPVASFLGIEEKGGLRVLSTPDGADVFIDGQKAGKTPYEDKNLVLNEYDVVIKKDEVDWEGKVRVNSGTLTVVNRDIAKDTTSAAGELLTLEGGRGVGVTSAPVGATVEVDGKDLGKTPLLIQLETGEHTFTISRIGFLKRSFKAFVPENYRLNAAIDLSVTDIDLSQVPAPEVVKTSKLIVKQTPTGFLRVREKPNLTSKEVGRVSPGDELIFLEESSGWNKVRLTSGTEGYVSRAYIVKKSE